MEYAPTIGLEVHVELKTRTKMFCDSANAPDEKTPNVNICPICMGHPGTLPVINKGAIVKVLELGLAIKGNLAGHAQFDRKNYFYPDLPKGYQISQYKHPLVTSGALNGIGVERIHIEEDTAQITHFDDYSTINYNRAGVPLMELVTLPVITSGREARMFAEELHMLLRYLGISDASMEKGQMRIEANISVLKYGGLNQSAGLVDRTGLVGKPVLGTKVEIKNLNSFRSVERSINYEIIRQSRELDDGRAVAQETRGWDDVGGVSFSQRTKEEAHDYRYIPEPDLPPLDLTMLINELKDVELPRARHDRLIKQYNLPESNVDALVYDRALMDYFETVTGMLGNQKAIILALNYLINDTQALISEHNTSFSDITLQPKDFSSLIAMLNDKKITTRVAKDVLRIMFEEGGDPTSIVADRNLARSVDIARVARQVIEENEDAVREYKAGKKASIKYLLGQGMAITHGGADPKALEAEILNNL